MQEEVTKLAHQIRQSIHAVNGQYAAVQGKDLFKATNDTVNALAGLADPVSSYEDYKDLIEQQFFCNFEALSTPR